jgi:hypothetical protein
MSVLKSVLKEEEKRLQSLSKMYRKKIDSLPKGSISLKKIRNGQYAYLAYREGKKVCFTYLGNASSDEALKMKAKIQERKKIESLMKQTIVNLHEVQGMLRGRAA